MTDMPVTCFLPCRRGSERIENKNTRPFGNFAGGLLEVKLRQLSAARSIERVIVSTNDSEVMSIAAGFADDRIQLVRRAEHLSAGDTSTDDLIPHVAELVHEGEVLWTHVTSPFITAEIYDRIAAAYRTARSRGFDSLMTVTPIRGFVWDDRKPLNYDRARERWPRTQTLKPLYEVNSGAFLSSVASYTRSGDRIGERPFLYPLDRVTGLDIDWMDDFVVAEALLQTGRAAV